MVSVTALAFANGYWAGPVWAQTVPSLTPMPPASQVQPPSGARATAEAPTATPIVTPLPATTQPPINLWTPAPGVGTTTVAATGPGCGIGTHVTSLPDVITETTATNFGLGTVTARLGGAVASVTGDTVAADDLAEPAGGWQLLTQGLRVRGFDLQSRPVSYFNRGYSVCLCLPVGATSFQDLRIGYYDASPRLNRWVLLVTNVEANEACTPLFRQAATFALLAH
jgi:hypothetical protein